MIVAAQRICKSAPRCGFNYLSSVASLVNRALIFLYRDNTRVITAVMCRLGTFANGRSLPLCVEMRM